MRLEEGEEWEPDAHARLVRVAQHAVVGERVIIEEEARRDVERDEDVDRVVLVRREDEEDAEDVHHPRRRVHVVQPARNVCKRVGSKVSSTPQ